MMDIPKNWTFKSSEVVNGFDDHVKEQLPWYNMAIDLTAHLVRCYLPDDGVMLDLGCSTGSVTSAVKQTILDRNVKALSIDNSKEMVKSFAGVGKALVGDMTDMKIIPEYDVCVLFLSAMFVKPALRDDFINDLREKCRYGGIIIVLDKADPLDGYLGTSITRMAIKNKLNAGVDAMQILEKELSLCGVQRPSERGFWACKGFQRWFQIGDFIGYIYEKKTR